jgi:molecular chaperone GrpE
MTKKKPLNDHEKDHKIKHNIHSNEDITDQNSDLLTEAVNSQPDLAEQINGSKDQKEKVSSDEKLAEMVDKYIRLSAEFDNYRKRTLREKIELTKSAGEGILKNLLPVMDDLERALKQMEFTKDVDATRSGIELIYNKFLLFLKQNGIIEIEAVNKDFNVDLHEAITKIPAPNESKKGKVIEVVEKGYFLNDKVMRYSKVVVGE